LYTDFLRGSIDAVAHYVSFAQITSSSIFVKYLKSICNVPNL